MTSQTERNTARLHYIAAFIGGFLGLYPILNVIGLLGSAQTSNLISLVLSLIGADWKQFALHGICAALYILAVFTATMLSSRTKINLKFLALLVDVLTSFVMFFYPRNLPPQAYLFPVAFAMAFQWSSFPGAYGFACSTIFSTNNLKQLVSSSTEVIFNGKKEFKLKAKFFGATLCSFHLGVTSIFLLWRYFGNISFTAVIVPVIIGLSLVSRYEGILKN